MTCAGRTSLLVALLASPALAAQPELQDLTDLSLAQLAEVEVSTASRRPQARNDVPAALHIISGQDIRRSGETMLPEVLRLAPGTQIARIDSNKHAVAIRGFPGRLSRSMLVMVDGRSVYNTLFAGTLWETPDLLFDDVDRIEVVRGPGGALWGANAVQGIVNVVSRSAADTQGGFLRGRLGTEERALRARHGGRAGDDFHYRVWGKLFDRDGGDNERFPGFDDWHMLRVGARADWQRSDRDMLTLDLAAYDGRIGQVLPVVTYEPPAQIDTLDEAELAGGHALARWRRQSGAASSLVLQAWFDVANRDEGTLDDRRDTLDVEGVHHFPVGTRHGVTWGAAVRRSAGDTTGIETYRVVPPRRVDTIASGFGQWESRLASDRLQLSVGAKLERNQYSGWEVQPHLRGLFHVAADHTVWASLSSAVRTPSRTERDAELTGLIDPSTPAFVRVLGSPEFMSERVQAVEAGYRSWLLDRRLAVDVAGFYTRHDDLLGLRIGEPFVEAPARVIVPATIANLLSGRTWGSEVAATTRLGDHGGAQASWSFLRVELEPEDGHGGDPSQEVAEDFSPRHQLHVLAWLDLPHGVGLSATWRRVGELPAQRVPAYQSLTARLSWQRSPVEVAVVGQNLLLPRHLEWGGGVEGPTGIERAVYGQATLRW